MYILDQISGAQSLFVRIGADSYVIFVAHHLNVVVDSTIFRRFVSVVFDNVSVAIF